MPRIWDELLDAVFFLYESASSAAANTKEGGTGFFVTVPSLATPGLDHLYAVTAAHNIVKGATVIRQNLLAGSTRTINLSQSEWRCNEHLQDLAVAEVPLDPASDRANAISTDAFVTRELISNYEIGPGDETFTVGRFAGHEGTKANLVSARFGNISMMPLEPVPHPKLLDQESFLVESRSLSGYSGSPVFVHLPSWSLRPRHHEMTKRGETLKASDIMGTAGPWLLGVDWGHPTLREPVRGDEKQGPASPSLWVEANTGQMLVVPAWRIAEQLMDEHWSRRRESASSKL